LTIKYSDDRTALVIDMEAGNVKTNSRIPPDWTGDVEEIQFEMTKIRNKLKELIALHDKHLNRPTMDDNFDEEKHIDRLTQEITQVNFRKNENKQIRTCSYLLNNF
jgi:syntaxin 16